MGKVLDIISKPVVDRTEVVEWQGETYTLTGRPDANLLGRTLLLTEDQRATKAKHYANLTGLEFDPSIVPQVLLVSECLQHEDDPSARYDESEIARLAVANGILLAQLFGAAARCIGLEDGPTEAVAGAAAGE